MAQKWIINNGYLKIGNVELHADLAKDHSTTKGGGYWFKEGNTLILYGSSHDYDHAEKQDVLEAYKSPSVEVLDIFFSTQESLAEAMKEYYASKENSGGNETISH